MKKALVIIGLCLLFGYLIFAAFYFRDKPMNEVCSDVEVVVENGENQFISTAEITKYIEEKGLNPVGKSFDKINTLEIEEAILNNKLIKSANVFMTNNDVLRIVVTERKPVLRIMTATGESYYIDEKGDKMPLSRRSTAYLPLATGYIKEDLAKGDLYKFALFLHGDKFWNAQIEQIVVGSDGEISLVPRVGNHRIVMGNLDGYKTKLDKLMTFYENGLNKIGWNKYSVINLRYDKQVVCTKR